jgi:hypothetical protein
MAAMAGAQAGRRDADSAAFGEIYEVMRFAEAPGPHCQYD